MVLKKERERSKEGSASTGRLWLEGPYSCLGRATVLVACSSFSSLKRKKINQPTNSNFFQIFPAATNFTSCSH